MFHLCVVSSPSTGVSMSLSVLLGMLALCVVVVAVLRAVSSPCSHCGSRNLSTVIDGNGAPKIFCNDCRRYHTPLDSSGK